MDIVFKCPTCEQELEVDASGAGSEIQCPACNSAITVPFPDQANVAPANPATTGEPPAGAPPPPEPKHFTVPVHKHTPDSLIQKSQAKTLDVIAKEGDKKLRIKTFKRTDCMEVGKDHFDEKVSAFLELVGHNNIVSVVPVNYSYVELGSRALLTDYGVLIVFKG